MRILKGNASQMRSFAKTIKKQNADLIRLIRSAFLHVFFTVFGAAAAFRGRLFSAR